MSARMACAVASPSFASRTSRCASADGPNASRAAAVAASPVTYGSRWPRPRAGALARPAVVHDHHVAQLDAALRSRRGTAPAGDHAAAEPRAEREHHEVLHTATHPGPPLADRRRVRVVVEPDRKAEPPDIQSRSAKSFSGRFTHSTTTPRDLVDRRRSSEPDRRDLVVRSSETAASSSRTTESCESCGVGALVPAHDRAVPRDDAGEDLRAAEVDADRVRGAHAQRVP